jgi:hypothetical protein
VKGNKPAKWATAIHHEQITVLALSHASRVRFPYFRHPGVSLRFTPGFMLAPATRVFKVKPP